MAGIDSLNVVNGHYGAVFHEGAWLANFNKGKADVDIQKGELKLSGDRWIRHKVLSLKGTGSISGYKVTSELIQFNTPVADSRNVSVRTELVMKLDDPEAYGVERIRLMNVMFDKIQLADWEAGKEVNEEWAFTFEGYELLDPIEAT